MSVSKGSKPGTMLKHIIDHADLTKGPSESVDEVMRSLESAGFHSTRLSVLQAISVARRLKGYTQRAERRSTQSKRKIKQNPRVEALGSFVDDALKGLQMLKGELKRLKDIEKKYNAIKAQFGA